MCSTDIKTLTLFFSHSLLQLSTSRHLALFLMVWSSFLLVTHMRALFTHSFIPLATAIYLTLSAIVSFSQFMIVPAYFLFFLLAHQVVWRVGHFSGKNSWPKGKAAIIYLTNKENGWYQTGFVWDSTTSSNTKRVNLQPPSSVNVLRNNFWFTHLICIMYIHLLHMQCERNSSSSV